MTNLYVVAAIAAAWILINFFGTGKSRNVALKFFRAALMVLGASVIYYYNL
jgi:hypothetical protein